MLFQAQDKGGEVPPDVLLKHLIETEHIAQREIVIATGDQRGLDGIDLFDRACEVRFVITVEALKEGWDCSFAYVLCSLQNVRSSKDVEQLLGRVLRMPNARKRKSPALNRAYAHVLARSFSEAASALADRMVEGMGFDRLNAAQVLLPDPGIDDLFAGTPVPPREPVFRIELPAATAQALIDLPDVHVTVTGATAVAEVKGEVSDSEATRIAACVPVAERAAIAQMIDDHNAGVQAQRSPAERGVLFAPLPRLCVQWQGELHLVERETLAELVAFDLLRADPRPDLPGFALVEQSDLFEIYLNAAKVEWRQAQGGQLTLDAVPSEAGEDELLRWLAGETRRDSITPHDQRAWLARLLGELQQGKGLSLTGLVRARHLLVQAVMRRLDQLEAQAYARGFRQLLLEPDAADDWKLLTSPEWKFRFEPGRYPARNAYQGRQRFNKHFFAQVHHLKGDGEEFACAQMLDRHPRVKHWVRNIERQPEFSFWLPTATDYFYPDFVAELNDGRLVVVEYKGEVYATNDDSREKKAVGKAWAGASEGRALFTFIERELNGMDMAQQFNGAIGPG